MNSIIDYLTKCIESELTNYISLNEMIEENYLEEELINLPEVQHYYDYNIPTEEL